MRLARVRLAGWRTEDEDGKHWSNRWRGGSFGRQEGWPWEEGPVRRGLRGLQAGKALESWVFSRVKSEAVQPLRGHGGEGQEQGVWAGQSGPKRSWRCPPGGGRITPQVPSAPRPHTHTPVHTHTHMHTPLNPTGHSVQPKMPSWVLLCTPSPALDLLCSHSFLRGPTPVL